MGDGLRMVIHLGHSQEEVTAFLQNEFGEAWDKRVHLPIGGNYFKQQIQADIGSRVGDLLNSP